VLPTCSHDRKQKHGDKMILTLLTLERLQQLLQVAELSPFSLLPPLSILVVEARRD
jgi:hypothetical protein